MLIILTSFIYYEKERKEELSPAVGANEPTSLEANKLGSEPMNQPSEPGGQAKHPYDSQDRDRGGCWPTPPPSPAASSPARQLSARGVVVTTIIIPLPR